MSKRLTVGKWGGEDERACDGCKWFGEPNGCNRKDGACDAYERHQSIYARLTEVEDVLYDADGNEVIPLARLRAIAEAERDMKAFYPDFTMKTALEFLADDDGSFADWLKRRASV